MRKPIKIVKKNQTPADNAIQAKPDRPNRKPETDWIKTTLADIRERERRERIQFFQTA